MKLSDLLGEVKIRSIHGPVDRLIRALRYDSRRVERDDVFFAWKGEKTDGHHYIAEVCDKGAAAVVFRNSAHLDRFALADQAIGASIGFPRFVAEAPRKRHRARVETAYAHAGAIGAAGWCGHAG